MNESLSFKNPRYCRDFRLADHWRFSNETALRIPELIHALFHRLEWHELNVLSGLKPGGSSIRTDFTRRILDQDTNGRRIYQFTYSNHFAQYSTDERKIEGLSKCCKAARDLMRDVSEGCLPGWSQALTAFCLENKDQSDHRMVEKLRTLRVESFSEEKWDVTFENLTLLYEFYSRIPLIGYLASILDKEHFRCRYDKQLASSHGGPQALAYFLQIDYNANRSFAMACDASGTTSHRADRGKLPPIIAFWKVDCHANAYNLLPADARFIDQPRGDFFPLVKDITKDGIELLHTRLWKVFNSDKPPEHHLAIPIYELDDLTPGSRPQDQTSLMTQGAFLGWFFLSFPRKAYDVARKIMNFPQKNVAVHPNWVSRIRACSLKKTGLRLADDVRRIRHVLNEFSERYLLGEMEWALERDFKEGHTALDFTIDHYHHCDGWVGERIGNRKLPIAIASCYSLFCKCADGNVFTPIWTDGLKWSPSNVTHILINVAYSMSIGLSTPVESQIICLRRRTDTALSLDAEHARQYGHRIAIAVRKMFDAATYVVGARIQEKDNTLDAISHEVKQVAIALLGNWIIKPEAALRDNICEFFRDGGYHPLPENSVLCPEPRLIITAAKIIQLWTGSRDPLVFFDVPPPTMHAALEGIWGVVIETALGVLTRKANLNEPSGWCEYKEYETVFRQLFAFDDIFTVEQDARNAIPLPCDDSSRIVNARWLVVIKVLLAKFKDVVRHAHPEKKRCIKVKVHSGSLSLEIINHNLDSNSFSDINNTSIRVLYKALRDTQLFRSANHGDQILKQIESESDGFVSLRRLSENDADLYRYAINFNWEKAYKRV